MFGFPPSPSAQQPLSARLRTRAEAEVFVLGGYHVAGAVTRLAEPLSGGAGLEKQRLARSLTGKGAALRPGGISPERQRASVCQLGWREREVNLGANSRRALRRLGKVRRSSYLHLRSLLIG